MKLTREQLEKKRQFHKRKAKYYKKKIDALDVNENRIGYKWYK